jgi:hypothetical protein
VFEKCNGGTAQLLEIVPPSKDQPWLSPSIRTIRNSTFKYFWTLPISRGQAVVDKPRMVE